MREVTRQERCQALKRGRIGGLRGQNEAGGGGAVDGMAESHKHPPQEAGPYPESDREPWKIWKPKRAMIKYSHQKSQILVPE